MSDAIIQSFLDDMNGIKPVDGSPANIERGLKMLDRALGMITHACKTEEFQQSRIYINQKDIQLDARAIRQLFDRTQETPEQ